MEVPRPEARRDGEPLQLLVDSTGLKLCGAGEWLIEKPRQNNSAVLGGSSMLAWMPALGSLSQLC